ncbi:translation initiation factor eIF3 subunit g [Chytridiales sp. JEL 0842]|nr:translation initiation factor eIF3 subunit g [Chytridiales sp. JEL 0842]
MPSSVRWGDDVDEAEDFNTPRTHIEPDGTKVVVDYRVNDDGKKVRVTSRIRTSVITTQVNPQVARRRQLKKFGDSAGLKPGPDSNSTSFGEKVYLKMSTIGTKKLDEAPVEDEVAKLKVALGNSKIMCRICKGDHWTTKCPFKDTHKPLDVPPEGKDDMPSSAPAGSTGSKYVPPNRRGGAAGGAGESMGPTKSRDDFYTLRITNLSEDTTEQDLKDLVSRFGGTSRVFVARDKETNQCKGFGFVSFYHKDDAEKALRTLDGFGYDNLILHVEFAKNKERD